VAEIEVKAVLRRAPRVTEQYPIVLAVLLGVGLAVIPSVPVRGDGGMGSGGSSGHLFLVGVVEGLPASGLIGEWTVGGIVVHVSSSTAIDKANGNAAVNAPVRVQGEVQPDGSVNATEIVVETLQSGELDQHATAMTFSVLHLKPTQDAPEGAHGLVITRQLSFADGGVRGDLKVSVEHLLPDTAYEVLIDTIDAGPIMTNRDGEGRLFLSTADVPGAEPLPTELRSFDALQGLDVAESGGVIVSGSFADANKFDRDHPGLDYLGVAILNDDASKVLGMAAACVKGDEQGLALTVWGLKPGETYGPVIDGGSVGELVASAQGRIQVEYWSAPTGEEPRLPNTLMPVTGLMHAELQDSGGTTVASGDFQTVLKPGLSTVSKVLKRRLQH
jgi:hypothetical protein